MKPEAVKVGKYWWIRRVAGKTTRHYEWLSDWGWWQWNIVKLPRRGREHYFRSFEAAEKYIAKWLEEDHEA